MNELLPKIIPANEKLMVGIGREMSFENFLIKELWQEFMINQYEISNRTNNELISLTVYPITHDFNIFNPRQKFVKWAGCEVNNIVSKDNPLQSLIIPAGLYAVFGYKGLSTDPTIFRYIYGEWLPKSIYKVDNRPHFEVLGEKYKNNKSESEEEIWIPIGLKH